MMTRSWMLYASPFAFAAGMTLVHCSSSSSTGAGPVDSGKMDTGKGNSGSGSASGTGSTKHDAGGSSSGSGSSSGTGTGVKDAGSDAFNGYQSGDQPDACAIPDGGTTCTPGTMNCVDGGGGCGFPAHQCCEVPDAGNVCQPFTGADAATCGGDVIQCEESGDCTAGNICCLNALTASPATALISCQPAPTCSQGMGIASGQICRSNNECASGECIIYSCLANSVTIQACKGTVNGALAGTCTPSP